MIPRGTLVGITHMFTVKIPWHDSELYLVGLEGGPRSIAFQPKIPRWNFRLKVLAFVSFGLDQGSAKPDLPPVFMVHKLRLGFTL